MKIIDQGHLLVSHFLHHGEPDWVQGAFLEHRARGSCGDAVGRPHLIHYPVKNSVVDTFYDLCLAVILIWRFGGVVPEPLRQ